MTLYVIIMFLTAVLFAVLSVVIYRGRTDLIHDYHQTQVKDTAAYGKAFAKALSLFACGPFASGMVAWLANDVPLAVIVLFIAFAVGIGLLAAVQMKYNRKK